MDELIPGNMIDHIWGADDPEIDNADIAQCQEMILNAICKISEIVQSIWEQCRYDLPTLQITQHKKVRD